MATSVNNAFEEFLKNKVRLDSERNKIAKASKDWLMDQIKSLALEKDFPDLHDTIPFLSYGSYSRKTKIRPLDDIDFMVVMHAKGGYYDYANNNIVLVNQRNNQLFAGLCHDGTNYLNSIKIINRFKSALAGIHQYKNADMKRNQEALTLELQTYEWVYDIVPCFHTVADWAGKTYFLIPDGKGHWKKTDPRIDKKRVEDIGTLQAVSVLDAIRLVKYWNGRPVMPSAPSYMLEVMVLNFFRAAKRSDYIDYAVRDLFDYIATAVWNPVNDPKQIQGDLNILSRDDKNKISSRAAADYKSALEASALELQGNMKQAITKWGEIFGPEFPTYNT